MWRGGEFRYCLKVIHLVFRLTKEFHHLTDTSMWQPREKVKCSRKRDTKSSFLLANIHGDFFLKIRTTLC